MKYHPLTYFFLHYYQTASLLELLALVVWYAAAVLFFLSLIVTISGTRQIPCISARFQLSRTSCT